MPLNRERPSSDSAPDLHQRLIAAGVSPSVEISIPGPVVLAAADQGAALTVRVGQATDISVFSVASDRHPEPQKALYDNIFSRFGPPKSLLSDRGTAFLSKIVADLCKRFKVKQIYTSSYHPQTNSTVERVWSVLWAALRATCVAQTDWEDKISSIAYAFRCTPSTSSKFTPAMLLYGREMNLPLQSALLPTATGTTSVDTYIRQLLPRVQLTRRVAMDNIKAAKGLYKRYYDKDSRPTAYEPGDMVWLHNSYNPKGVCPKLRRKYERPYFVTHRTEHDTYSLFSCSRQ